MANADLVLDDEITTIPAEVPFTITDANAAMRVLFPTKGRGPYKITVCPRTNAMALIPDDSIVADAAIVVADHFNIAALGAAWLLGGGDPDARTTGFPRAAGFVLACAAAAKSGVLIIEEPER